MRVLVPFDPRNPKSRLAPILNEDERQEFARTMLKDVIEAIRETGITPDVLTPTRIRVRDASILVDDRPLSSAVNATLDATVGPIAVVMADLPLITPAACSRLFKAEGEVVFARGLGGGTNALVTRHPEFAVDYHGTSYHDHLQIAENHNLSVTELDSFRFAVDIDQPEDLVEILLHGDGQAHEWLRSTGFRLENGDGRMTAKRINDQNTMNRPGSSGLNDVP
ncbi:2-phospho-L-lactate guanylyltransferase [Haladaptatus sp. NG-SE-30]